MIIEPQEDQPEETVAQEAVWATLEGRLEQAGDGDLVPDLRELLRLAHVDSATTGPYTRHTLDLYQRLSAYSSLYNAEAGEQLGWFFEALGQDSQPVLDHAACLDAAKGVAKPPIDARLQTAEFEEHGGETVFIARWTHLHDGVPVERDFIQVMVNARTGRAFSHQRQWHEVDLEPGAR